MEKLFPITQVMGNEENRAATEEFIACCHGDGYPTIVEQSGSKIVGDVMYGDENVEELTDGEEDARDQSASETTLGMRSHPDDSIYNTRGTIGSGWEWDYRIESK
ncbi:hypothetical protein OsJ_15005 [Oryza sativa Japonica Group]|uniref:Uncharacterized protein n=1 Tax=Oryza sativa subsp. japonica TaxID=39947 RepID=A3AUD6_ORYSJ|nr:hypothetical protein OsJ_15005 [Oryza sativa Japonica Group]